jgi:hypothetical protein
VGWGPGEGRGGGGPATRPRRANFFGLVGKYQWRLVAVEAWCCGEKKSGELCFE